MPVKINQIIETAITLDSRILKDYLYEMQSKSSINSKVFFGLLKSEIEKIKSRDKELIDNLEKRGLGIFYKYDLLGRVVDDIIDSEFLKKKLTPELARILGFDIEPNPNDLRNSKQPPYKKKTSYIWQSNPNKELPELFRLMIDKYKLIASDTTLEQFTATFTGQTIESIIPIKWHQDNASELLYFIQRLEQSYNIEHNPKKADYQKMTGCFVRPDGNQFKASWKSLKTHIETNLSLDKQKAIDELVNNFL